MLWLHRDTLRRLPFLRRRHPHCATLLLTHLRLECFEEVREAAACLSVVAGCGGRQRHGDARRPCLHQARSARHGTTAPLQPPCITDSLSESSNALQGDVVVRQGDPGNVMYFIADGQVEVRLYYRPAEKAGGAVLSAAAWQPRLPAAGAPSLGSRSTERPQQSNSGPDSGLGSSSRAAGGGTDEELRGERAAQAEPLQQLRRELAPQAVHTSPAHQRATQSHALRLLYARERCSQPTHSLPSFAARPSLCTQGTAPCATRGTLSPLHTCRPTSWCWGRWGWGSSSGSAAVCC